MSEFAELIGPYMDTVVKLADLGRHDESQKLFEYTADLATSRGFLEELSFPEGESS